MRRFVHHKILMFGNLCVYPGRLCEESAACYKSVYCGLCRSLRERHGQAAGFTLNYDMTFLVILLSSLYEPQGVTGSAVCLPHPFVKRDFIRNRYTDYCADMNVALSYLKCLDDVKDEGRLSSSAAAAVLKKSYLSVREDWPEQCSAMEKAVNAIAEYEWQNEDNPDLPAAAFGELLGILFSPENDRWKPALTSLGESLGRFIYLADACIDLDKDVKKGCYNPFRRYYGLDNAELFRGMLKLYLADSLFFMDKLPLVSYSDILKNILCFGVWTGFDAKYGQEKNAI